MSEAEIREGLRAAVGDEPPLDFDPDELIARARHARKRRRALVAVGVATLVLTGTVLSLPGVLDRRAGVEVASGGPVLTTTVEPPPSSPVTPPPVAPDGDRNLLPSRWGPPATTVTGEPRRSGTEVFLAQHFGALFSRVVPGAKVVEVAFDDNGGQGDARFARGLLQFLDAEGTSGVSVQLGGGASAMSPVEFCRTVTCVMSQEQPDGSRVDVATGDGGPEGTAVLSAAHFRVDGTVVRVNAYNYDPAQGGTLRDTVPLSPEQLIRLAVDPKVALF